MRRATIASRLGQRRGHEGPTRRSGSRAAVAVTLVMLTMFNAGCAGGLNQWFHNGFKVGPQYAKPAAPVADMWIDADNPKLTGEPVDDACWWQVLNDPVLDSLVRMAYEQNLPLRIAGLRVLEARAQLGIARGNLFPQQQQAFADYQRTQLSKNTANNPIGVQPGFQRAFNFFDVGFDAAWELDVWGRFRRSIESANASLDADIEGYDDILVTLIGDVAATYVQIRTVEQQLAFSRQNVDIQQGSLELAEVRFRNGATTELDVQQAKTSLANTRALIPQLEAEQRQAENRLCILMGMPPHDLRYILGETGKIPDTPAEIAVGIPADLLRRRPDVRQAERQAASQSARIGIAYADLFPSFTLIGSIGVEAANTNNLFNGGSVAGFLAAPSISWNILNYGRIRNNINVQDARFEQAVVNYQNTVLQANQEVEDGLVGFFKAQESYREDVAAVAAAKRSVELALTQYRDGATDFNRVFTLQSILTTQQNQLAATKGSIAVNLISIYKALGGGWQLRINGCPAMPESVVAPAPEGNGQPMPPINGPMPPMNNLPMSKAPGN